MTLQWLLNPELFVFEGGHLVKRRYRRFTCVYVINLQTRILVGDTRLPETGSIPGRHEPFCSS